MSLYLIQYLILADVGGFVVVPIIVIVNPVFGSTLVVTLYLTVPELLLALKLVPSKTPTFLVVVFVLPELLAFDVVPLITALLPAMLVELVEFLLLELVVVLLVFEVVVELTFLVLEFELVTAIGTVELVAFIKFLFV